MFLARFAFVPYVGVVHSCRRFSLRLLFPCAWPNALLMMMEIPDLRSHISDHFVGRSMVLALRASRLYLYLVYRLSGAIPSSAHIAWAGSFSPGRRPFRQSGLGWFVLP